MTTKVKNKIESLCEKYGHYFGLDLHYFVKNSFWLGLGQGFEMLKNFILSIAFTRLLPKEIFGQYSFILAILSIVGIFALPGMKTALMQAIANGRDGTYKKIIKIIFQWSWLGSVFLICLAIYEHSLGHETSTLIFLLLAIIFPFYSISDCYKSFLAGQKKFNQQVFFDFIASLISLILLLATLFLTKELIWIVIVFAGSYTIGRGIFTWFTLNKLTRNRLIDKENIKLGKKLSWINVLNAIACQLDKVLVAALLGYQDLAIYSIAIMLPSSIKTIMDLATSTFAPKLVQLKLHIKDKSLWRHFWTITLLVVVLIIGYEILSPWVFEILYPGYVSALRYSQIIALGFISYGGVLFQLHFQSQKQAKPIATAITINSIIMIVLVFILGYYFGLWGVVLARALSRLISQLIFVEEFMRQK
ncbi:MAG: oligosaccharide flippase family protein [Patescibacteria group bacterium]|nr:oligosaccharide flippase family protein [Patescibacteria group bacterium]